MQIFSPALVLVVSLLASSAVAQSQQSQTNASMELPKSCQTPAARKMDMPMQSAEHMGQMTPTQKKLHEAMMKMHPAMMQGMMAQDADVAWICAMIPHHQGAIDMARAGLQGADDPESKKLAEETIKSNERELSKLNKWVETRAERESRNETQGSRKK